ncbi:hypothetical protein LSUE1_G000514 [Lachnellula suecica]|uniref:Uncharacterized protein n=1 Tax=Lachnellula suecica TaxID=602035 RepID=A0A8T9CFU8_9HELO|nr:hypothetical protein LSUE1_G000514 [Lachnellula suecica]
MESLLCCTNLEPFRPRKVDHELKFTSFMSWGKKQQKIEETSPATSNDNFAYAIQLVKQVNYGALESKRYFVPAGENFAEIKERELIDANFEKVNSYKNFKCTLHNKFFELNLYQKDPVNRHHWRANIARPADDIDLVATSKSFSVNEEATAKIEKPKTQPEKIVGKKEQNDEKLGIVKASSTAELGKSREKNEEEMGILKALSAVEPEDLDIEEQWGYKSGGYGEDGSDGSEKDFTACSASDCGYCGHCDY